MDGQKRKRSRSRYSGARYAKRSRTSPLVETKRQSSTMPTLGFDTVSTTWAEWDALGPITQGSDATNRIGRRIALKWVRFKGVLVGGAVGAGGVDDYYNRVRLCCYIGNYAKTGSVLTPMFTTGFTRNTPLRSTNLAGHRKTLLDSWMGLTNPPYGANLCAAGTRDVDFFYRFKKPLIVEYSGAGAHTNGTSLFFAMITDSSGVPNPGFSDGFVEIGFTDS